MSEIVNYHQTFQLNVLENYKDFCPITGSKLWGDSEKNKNGKFYSDKTEIIPDSKVKDYYADKSKGLTITVCEIKVIEKKDKISLRYSFVLRKRRVGRQYFSVSKTYRYVTYNYKTKNFYHGIIETSRKKVKSNKVRCNSFSLPFITEIKLAIRRNVNHILSKENWKEVLSTTPQMTKGDDVVLSALRQFAYGIFSKNSLILDYHSNYLEGELYKLYLKDNNISYPDSVNQFTVIQMSKKELKKYSNVVKYFMDESGLKGKKVREILNKSPNIGFKVLVEVFHNMKVDYFSKIRESFFTDDNNFLYHKYYNNRDFKKVRTFDLSNEDRKRVVNLINTDSEINWTIIKDHFFIIEKLKNYGEDFKMKFNNRDEFNEEHYHITELLESYKDGKISRFNGEEFKNELEKVIEYGNQTHYPILLLNSTQYNEESKTQSNCVRTYIDKPENFIVSVRKDNIYSDDRITVEYQIMLNGLNRVQSRKKFNQTTDEYDELILRQLDMRLNKLFDDGVFQLTKMVKEFNNGNFIEKEAKYLLGKEKYSMLTDGRITPKWDKDEEYFTENYDLPF